MKKRNELHVKTTPVVHLFHNIYGLTYYLKNSIAMVDAGLRGQEQVDGAG